MTTVNLYIGECRIHELGTFMGADYEISYAPIKARDVDIAASKMIRRVPNVLKPTAVIQLPEDWKVTHDHGITNVEMRQAVSIYGERRRFIPADLLAIFAHNRHEGCRVISGTLPFDRQATLADCVRQMGLPLIEFMEANR